MIEFIMLDLPKDEEVVWDGEAFKEMKSLKILIIKKAHFSQGPKHLPNSLRILDWIGYPSSSLPQDFHPRKLVVLNLTKGLFEMGKSLQKFKFLSHMELSDNKFLRRIPDISRLQNLKRLNVRGCTNLIEIHDSVGHHDRLKELYATGCYELRIFPRVMESKSVDHLDLSGCLNLRSFPEIFKNDMIICVHEIATHGPPIFVHSRFQRSALVMEGPSDFARLITSTYMLPKLDKSIVQWSLKVSSLMIEGCNLTDKVLVTWLSCFTNLEYLKLSKNTYTDEFLCEPLPFFGNLEVLDLTASKLTDNLFAWIPWFPNLVELVLSVNNFTFLPACIKHCRHLRTLVLNNCHQLETITEIPTSIKDLSAMGCRCLTSPSSRILLSQKLHEDGGTYFILPGSWIPEWFHHHWHGSSLSFWFREKFPSIALFAVHHIRRDTPTVQIRLNSHEIDFQLFGRYSEYSNSLDIEYVSLFDLDKIIQSSGTDVAKMKYRKNGWNHVEVEFIAPWVMWIGVHVYKKKTNIENVRFTSPLIGAKKRKRAREHVLRSPMK